MFLRKYWLPLAVFIVAIAGVGLYLLATQPPPEPVKIHKAVEPIEKPIPPTTAEPPVGDTSQGGHFHADGTWHEGAHVPVEQPEKAQSDPPMSQVSETQNASTLTQEKSAGERQHAQYAERFLQYREDSHVWWNKFQTGHEEIRTERQALINLLSDMFPDSPEEFTERSSAETLEIGVKLQTQLEKLNVLNQKQETIRQEEPVRPTPPDTQAPPQSN